MTFGAWRTWQHYVEVGSIPDIVGPTVSDIIAARHKVPTVGSFPLLIAELVDDRWSTIGFLRPTSVALSTRREDPDIYDDVRYGRRKASPPGRVLDDKMHPKLTEWVGRVL